jgi:hypothetical protein
MVREEDGCRTSKKVGESKGLHETGVEAPQSPVHESVLMRLSKPKRENKMTLKEWCLKLAKDYRDRAFRVQGWPETNCLGMCFMIYMTEDLDLRKLNYYIIEEQRKRGLDYREYLFPRTDFDSRAEFLENYAKGL